MKKNVSDGDVFHRLTIISKSQTKKYHWNCLCICGKECVVATTNLIRDRTRSCGCYHSDQTKLSNTKHGCCRRLEERTSEYTAWCKMKERCYNINIYGYKNYGGRGVKVCDRWLECFDNFLEDMGKRPSPKHSLDRFPDINGNYEPSNCRWGTKFEQDRGMRRNKWYEYNGIKMVQIDWARYLNISQPKIWVLLKTKTIGEIYEHYLKEGKFTEKR
jgi:hypothetical protein